jgi:hypothetical protein
MWRTASVAATLLVLLSGPAAAQKAERVQVELDPGTNRKTFEDRIEGYETFDYIVQGKAGQSLAVVFKSKMWGAYINIYPPGSDTAMHIGGNRGNRFEGILPETGDYRVHVFLMDNAAHLDQIAEFTIEFTLGDGDAPSQDPDDSDRASGETGARTSGDPEALELVVRTSGEIEVSFGSGCSALYGSDATRVTADASCSTEQLRQAAEAVEAHLR